MHFSSSGYRPLPQTSEDSVLLLLIGFFSFFSSISFFSLSTCCFFYGLARFEPAILLCYAGCLFSGIGYAALSIHYRARSEAQNIKKKVYCSSENISSVLSYQNKEKICMRSYEESQSYTCQLKAHK